MKKLLILLIFIGVLVMFKNINAIINDSIGNITYRGNVVTGIVAKDNGDKSYDCYISESEVAYPKIFTLSREPNLAVGDKVRILYKGGCKELPIILPPTTAVSVTPLIAVIIEQYNDDDYLKFFTTTGDLVNSYLLGNGVVYFPDDSNGMAIDKYNNVYFMKSPNTLVKINSEGVILKSLPITGDYIEYLYIGIDGYLYSATQGTKVEKRNTSDLTVISLIDVVSSSNGFALDSNGNMYLTNGNYIEKKTSEGVLIGSHAIANRSCSCLGVSNNYILRTSASTYGWTYKMPIALGNEITITLTNIEWVRNCSVNPDSFFIIGENYSEDNMYLEKRKEDSSLVWSIVVDDSHYTRDWGMVAVYPF